MPFIKLIDRTYDLLARSRAVTRAAVHARGIASAVLSKRMAPTTLASQNGEYRLLRELSLDARVVVDVGANVGEWSETALHLWPQLERLICFEPVAWAADELERRLGSDSRVALVRRPVTDRPRTLTFWEEPVGGTMSSGVAGHSGSGAVPRSVEATTIDDELGRLGVERVDFLKIDAEGLDLHVMRGAARMLQAQLVDVVQFEYSVAWQDVGSTLRAAYALLTDAGYRVLLVTPDGLSEFPLNSTSELFTYANFIGLSPRLRAHVEIVPAIW